MPNIINAQTSPFAALTQSNDGTAVLQLQTGSTAALTIDASQNVGIGTASPDQKLTIVGNQKITGYIELRSANKVYFDDSGNTNSGAIWNAGTGANLSFGNSSTELMRLDTSGNLGLGVTPSAWAGGTEGTLQIKNASIYGYSTYESGYSTNAYYNAGWKYISTTSAMQYKQDTGGHKWFYAPSGTAGTSVSFTQAMTLDASGNLGIGTSSPSTYNGKLVVKTADQAVIGYFGGTTYATRLGANGSYAVVEGVDAATGVSSYQPLQIGGSLLKFDTGGSERMRIDSSGNVGIGTSSPLGKLTVKGLSGYNLTLGAVGTDARIDATNDTGSGSVDFVLSGNSLKFNTTGSERMRISATGGLSVGTTADPGAGAIYATGNITAYYSDDRLKTKLGGIKNALDKVKSLSGFYYEANQTAQDLGYQPVREVGVSAQQVQAVLPEVVKPAPIDQQYLTVDYERLVPLLIEAIKELEEKVAKLEGK